MAVESHWLVQGTGVVPGIAYAPAAWVQDLAPVPQDDRVIPEAEREAEKARFGTAVETVAQRFEQRALTASGVATEVLMATAGLTRDRGWTRAANKLILAGRPAAMAANEAIDGFVSQLQALGGLMAERTTDLKDVRNRVTAELMGVPEPGIPKSTTPIVLMATDLAPADTAGLDPHVVVALVTAEGGPTSHTAIIARQFGIPCIVAVSDLRKIVDGTPVLVNGSAGDVHVGVPLAEAQALVAEDGKRRDKLRAWVGPAATADGVPVQLLANVQDGPGAQKAAKAPVEGVGLFRTELCFLSAQTEPTVAEQAAIYGEVLAAFPGHKVVIRTLDAGMDKPVPFAKIEHEENPALGVRGIRMSLANEGMLDRQLDGIANAVAIAGEAKTWVMAPMIATVDEAKAFADEVHKRGLVAGVMVEVPAVAMMAKQILEVVDFLSIGTNDLTQYTMAADRMAPTLADLTDPWQPGVLRLVARTAKAGKKAGKPVGVCGEAAADPVLACVLIGMGITSLSMAVAAVPAVGVQLGEVTMDDCKAAAKAVLKARTAREARWLATEALAKSKEEDDDDED
ncbi:MAG: phosphoenolpyruvate--protein phosphotransferase [Micropruina sp.]|nr:phosphoenolpyruvate--protein phosphotransferase [Micropruina sp.]